MMKWRIEGAFVVDEHGKFVCNHYEGYGPLIVAAPDLREALRMVRTLCRDELIWGAVVDPSLPPTEANSLGALVDTALATADAV